MIQKGKVIDLFNSNQEKIMDDYLMNTMFAADLTEYLSERLNWPNENEYTLIFKQDCRKSQYDDNIGDAVQGIMDKNHRDFGACSIELRKVGVANKEDFRKCALSAAGSYFSNGYSPGSFLGYCAIVMGVATYFHEYPPNGIPEAAVEVIALVLLAHQLTGQFYEQGGWDSLRETACLFNTVCNYSIH